MTGPYKSKLFNFLNRQSLNLRDKLTHVARQMKIAVEWGVQILIYPLYLLVQAGRMAGYQLRQGSKQKLTAAANSVSEKIVADDRPLIAVQADHLIESILREVEPWLSSAELPENSVQLPIPSLVAVNPSLQPSGNLVKLSSLNSALVIQGVANSLENRSLVIVTPDNQILDILSEQQQQQLQQRMRTEIANYYYLQKLQKNTAHQFSGLIPTFVTEKNHVLPQVRWFWKTIRWVQTSQLATTLNLFGESKLISLEKPVSQAPSLPTTIVETPPILWVKLDRTLAELEILNETAPLVEVLQVAWQKMMQNLGHKGNSNSSLNPSEQDPFQIQAIIQAAIDYFFCQASSKFQLSDSQSQIFLAEKEPKTKGKLTEKSTLNQPLLAAADDDPWLAWDDLFIDTNSPEFSSVSDSPNTPILPSSSQPHQPFQNPLAETLKRNLKQEKILPKALQIPQKKSKELVQQIAENLVIEEKNLATKDKNISPVETSLPSPIINQENKIEVSQLEIQQENNDLDTFDDWIETEAKPVGYVKHPLEIILEWLDHIILWLEEVSVQIWSWLRQKIQSKKKKKKN